MKKVELLKILAEGLKMLSQCEVTIDDWRYVGMYEEYQQMRRSGLKYRVAVRLLASDYGVSRATVERVLKRLNGEC